MHLVIINQTFDIMMTYLHSCNLIMIMLYVSGVNPNFVYFTHTCVRGFVATPPFIPMLMFIIMFTFVMFSHQLTLPFPS